MKSFLAVALAACLLASTAHADPLPASDASIHQLLAVTQASKQMDGMLTQMLPPLVMVLKGSAQQTVGHPLDGQEQQILNRYTTRMGDILRNQFSWSRFEPSITAIYRKNFTQQEIDGMLAFYKTPIGQAMIAKMPEVARECALADRDLGQGTTPTLRQLEAAMALDLTNYEATKAKAAPAPASSSRS